MTATRNMLENSQFCSMLIVAPNKTRHTVMKINKNQCPENPRTSIQQIIRPFTNHHTWDHEKVLTTLFWLYRLEEMALSLISKSPYPTNKLSNIKPYNRAKKRNNQADWTLQAEVMWMTMTRVCAWCHARGDIINLKEFRNFLHFKRCNV